MLRRKYVLKKSKNKNKNSFVAVRSRVSSKFIFATWYERS